MNLAANGLLSHAPRARRRLDVRLRRQQFLVPDRVLPLRRPQVARHLHALMTARSRVCKLL